MLKTSSELPGKYCGWLEYSDIDDDNNDIKMNRHLWLEEIRVIIVEMEK